MRERSPDRAVWAAWTAVAVGGLAVLGAVALALRDPCLAERDRTTIDALEACASDTLLSVVTALTIGGTTLAVLGGLGAAMLAVRRVRAMPTATSRGGASRHDGEDR